MQWSSDDYDSFVHITDYELANKLGDSALTGRWFAYLRPDWLARSGMDKLMAVTGMAPAAPKAAILFRGQEVTLPGATIAAKELPRLDLLALTSDKALYRANRDTVRLLLAAPRRPGASLKLKLRLNGSAYVEHEVLLDDYGLALWSLEGLPEGEYEASIEDGEICRFEVAEYRLAALNAELLDQRLDGEVLHYTLGVTAFGQPYSGPVEIELQERGQRVSPRVKRTCDDAGRCQGVFRLTGAGPYTLNIFAGERSATVALKGSEQARRETLTISELGQIHEISLLPLAGAEECRGISVASAGSNTAPFLVSRVVDHEVEITARVMTEMLRVVVVNPTDNTCEERVYENLAANESLNLPIPAPYGVVLLGAFIQGKAWEGWCAVLRPADLEVQCEAPAQARPGQRVTITLKTNAAGRSVPVQLIVKDQRLIAPSDPRVELAACIKKALTSWHDETKTGNVERQLSSGAPVYRVRGVASAGIRPLSAPLPPPMAPSGPPMPTGAMPLFGGAPPAPGSMPDVLTASSYAGAYQGAVPVSASMMKSGGAPAPVAAAVLTKVRMQFPEVIYNNILTVQGQRSVEIKLGDSMTRYTVEAFALDTEKLDWRRAETAIEAVQPVYGELTVSPFVFPGDPVMGRLDVGASSGSALVEVRHDEETLLPLFAEDGTELSPGLPIPSGATLRFPVKPGAITAIVRDARTGEADVSERHLTEPGKLRHIMRRLRLLTPGEEVTLLEARVLEIKPMPGLERPFQFFVEGASKYPFG